MQYDEKQKKWREKKWAEEAGEKQEIRSQVIVVDPEGAALQIARNEWVKEWFQVEGAEPHVTLKVNPGYRPKDLGPMVRRAKAAEFVQTDNLRIWLSTDGTMMINLHRHSYARST